MRERRSRSLVLRAWFFLVLLSVHGASKSEPVLMTLAPSPHANNTAIGLNQQGSTHLWHYSVLGCAGLISTMLLITYMLPKQIKEMEMINKLWRRSWTWFSILFPCMGFASHQENNLKQLTESLKTLSSTNNTEERPPQLHWEQNDCWLCSLIAVITNAKTFCENVISSPLETTSISGSFYKLLKAMKAGDTKSDYQNELLVLLNSYGKKDGYDAGIGLVEMLSELSPETKAPLTLHLEDTKGNQAEKPLLLYVVTDTKEWNSLLESLIQKFRVPTKKPQSSYQITKAPSYLFVARTKSPTNETPNGQLKAQTVLTTKNNEQCTYELTGLVLDTSGGYKAEVRGHSIAYVKKPTGWYEGNYGPWGSTIKKVDKAQVLGPWDGGSRPSLLLYEKK